jgi:predicted ferric reductase
MSKDERSIALRIRQNLGGEVAIFLSFLGAGITLGFAISDANYSEAHSTAGIITLLSRFAALIGTYLMLIALLIIARIPWVEKSLGFDRLVAYHRKLGPLIYLLISTHFLLVIVGYSLADKRTLWEELFELLKFYPWMVQATIGYLLLSLISFTSTKLLRRRFKYEHWWNIHLLSYLAIALSFMHQILNGSLFLFNEAAKIWWIGLYIYTSFALVIWRFLLPVIRSLKHKLVVDHLVRETPTVVSIYISGRNLNGIHARGGNFFEWRFLKKGIWSQAHPYSLSESPSNNMMRITVKNLGDHSKALLNLTAGTRVIAEGPYGTLVASRAIGKKILLIGAGIGITPIRALVNELPHDAQIDLIYRVVKDEELVLRTELDLLGKEKRMRLHYLVGIPEKFPMTPKELLKLIPHIKECDVFVCGPPGLAKLVRHSVESLGVESRKFHNEAFSFHAN